MPPSDSDLSRPSSRTRAAGRLAALATAVVLLLAMTASAAQAGTSFSGTYKNASGSRAYVGYVPASYQPGTQMPLVVVLHGCGQTAADVREGTRFDAQAEARGFITVYPEQSQKANLSRCWNWFRDADRHRGRGEPSLIAGITDKVSRTYSVDARRVFVAGLSAGGAMSVVMGATYPDVYAALGVHSGCEYNGYPCGPSGGPDPVAQGALAFTEMGLFARVVPSVVFHGDRDTTVSPINGEQVVQQWISTNDRADDGSYNQSIATTPAATASGQVAGGYAYDVDTYLDAAGAPLHERWLVRGMGHAWSGGCSCKRYNDPAGPDATANMVAFFERHPKP